MTDVENASLPMLRSRAIFLEHYEQAPFPACTYHTVHKSKLTPFQDLALLDKEVNNLGIRFSSILLSKFASIPFSILLKPQPRSSLPPPFISR